MADRTDKEIQWLLDLQPLLKPSFNLADWETRDGGTMIMLYRLDGNGNPGTLYRGSRATLVWSRAENRVTGALWRGRTYSTAQGLADAWLAYADSEKGAEY
jgi:hypothetical protein